jgi:hypothetical protein
MTLITGTEENMLEKGVKYNMAQYARFSKKLAKICSSMMGAVPSVSVLFSTSLSFEV